MEKSGKVRKGSVRREEKRKREKSHPVTYGDKEIGEKREEG